MPVDRGGGGHDGWIISASTLLTPKSLPTGILYSPQFRFHQGTKMAPGEHNDRHLRSHGKIEDCERIKETPFVREH